MRKSLFLLLVAALAPVACATYREDLNRGQRMYEENKYENALAVWRQLEPDADSLTLNDQARYAYLRGMTDYRLGFRSDSRHWLAIAKATEDEHSGGLSVEWKERLDESLKDLNQDVYGGGERFDNSTSSAVERTKAAPSDSASAPTSAPATSAAPATSTAPNTTGGCRSNADCPPNTMCDAKKCVQL